MKFTPEMFKDSVIFGCDSAEHCADAAQAAFDKWLSGQPIVGCDYVAVFDGWICESGGLHGGRNHTARLVDIKEIGK